MTTPSLTVTGPPVTKKNSQMIARTPKGTPFIMQSAQSRKW